MTEDEQKQGLEDIFFGIDTRGIPPMLARDEKPEKLKIEGYTPPVNEVKPSTDATKRPFVLNDNDRF